MPNFSYFSSTSESRNMAFLKTNPHKPIRSISLPSRIHSPSDKLQASLSQLHLFQNSSDSQALQISLLNLSELYHSLHQLSRSLTTTQAEHSLDVSTALLDSCDVTRTLLVTLREHLQNLQFGLRRKGRSMEVEVKEYLAFRKKTKKETYKLLLDLKKLKSTETTELAVSLFRSLFMFLSTTHHVKTKTCSLKFVSKLIGAGRSSLISELQNLDVVLRSDDNTSKEVKKTLEILEERTKGLETALDSLFKSLVQYRVYVLNILTSS